MDMFTDTLCELKEIVLKGLKESQTMTTGKLDKSEIENMYKLIDIIKDAVEVCAMIEYDGEDHGHSQRRGRRSRSNGMSYEGGYAYGYGGGGNGGSSRANGGYNSYGNGEAGELIDHLYQMEQSTGDNRMRETYRRFREELERGRM